MQYYCINDYKSKAVKIWMYYNFFLTLALLVEQKLFRAKPMSWIQMGRMRTAPLTSQLSVSV